MARAKTVLGLIPVLTDQIWTNCKKVINNNTELINNNTEQIKMQ